MNQQADVAAPRTVPAANAALTAVREVVDLAGMAKNVMGQRGDATIPVRELRHVTAASLPRLTLPDLTGVVGVDPRGYACLVG